MLSKCANPECATPFHYLREGRLFQIDAGADSTGPQLVSVKRPAQKIEYFWLCGRCAEIMTLALHRKYGVVAVPLPGRTQRAVAS